MSDESEFFDLVGTGKPKRLRCARCGRKGYSQIDRVILCRKCERIWTESRMSAEHIRTWANGSRTAHRGTEIPYTTDESGQGI